MSRGPPSQRVGKGHVRMMREQLDKRSLRMGPIRRLGHISPRCGSQWDHAQIRERSHGRNITPSSWAHGTRRRGGCKSLRRQHSRTWVVNTRQQGQPLHGDINSNRVFLCIRNVIECGSATDFSGPPGHIRPPPGPVFQTNKTMRTTWRESHWG